VQHLQIRACLPYTACMPSPDPFDLPLAVPASLPVTTQLVQRVEAALVDAACGGESWREIPLQGELVRASQYRAPDVAAAKTLLAAHDPARYGQVEPVRPAPQPIQIAVTFVTAERKSVGALIDVTPSPPLGGYRDAISEGVGESRGIGTPSKNILSSA
jgi:hypothetical protein